MPPIKKIKTSPFANAASWAPHAVICAWTVYDPPLLARQHSGLAAVRAASAPTTLSRRSTERPAAGSRAHQHAPTTPSAMALFNQSRSTVYVYLYATASTSTPWSELQRSVRCSQHTHHH
jgi:hypothetical protein